MNGGTSSSDEIRAQQLNWARGIVRDSKRNDYVERIEDNLFLRRLSPDSEAEFSAADGAELKDTRKRPAKMRALVSSSALAVNFFDAWRYVNKQKLAVALGLPSDLSRLSFEFKPIGYPVRPRTPNLDLLLALSDGRCVAVESKFMEPYSGKTAAGLSQRYFSSPGGLWEAVNLPHAQRLADDLQPRWHYLDVAQLLKHMLGLASDPTHPFALFYLWYDTGLPDAQAHRDEVALFAEQVRGDGVVFLAHTYQEIFESMAKDFEPMTGWHAYFSGRYIHGATAVSRQTGSNTDEDRKKGVGLEGKDDAW